MKPILLSIFFYSATAGAHTSVDSAPPSPVHRETLGGPGYRFSVNGQSSSSRGAVNVGKAESQYRIFRNCNSGKARQVSPWETNYYEFNFPEKCVEVEGVELCEESSDDAFYSATATFQCL